MENIQFLFVYPNDSEYNQLIKNIEFRRNIGNFLNYKIYVYDKEGQNIPHFHIKLNGFLDCCIKIQKPEYFIHGSNTNTITKKHIKKLIKWLNDNDKYFWKEIIRTWNNHSINKLDINLEIPDYYNIR